MSRSVIGCIVAIAVAALLASAGLGHEVHRDIEYAVADGVSLRLDLYLPESPEGSVPLILWIHGGGWRAGDKEPTYAPDVLGEDYAVASVNYRLSQVALFPAQIHDIKAAVRFLRGNADVYGLDPMRFGAWGSSAGGHLAALLGTTCGVAEAEGALGDHLDQSSCVQAVCDFFGPTDLLVLLDERGGRETLRRAMPEDQLLGGPVEENLALAALASPIAHIDAGDPPFLILHGDNDQTVPIDQSIALDEALRAAGVESTLLVIEGAGHGFPREHWSHAKLFFDRHLRVGADASGDAVEESAVTAACRNGQTFVTWSETGAHAYGIYRTAETPSLDELATMEPIAVVAEDSSLNARATEIERTERRFVIVDRGEPLADGTGLYVHTVREDGDALYTVAALDADLAPAGWIGSAGPVREGVATPRPVLQSTTMETSAVRMHFVQWAPHGGSSNPAALSNRPGQSFNFVVRERSDRSSTAGAVFLLHGGGGNYNSQVTFPRHPDLLVVSPESIIPSAPRDVDRSWDAWYGYNEHVGTDRFLSDGVNVDYTTRRLRFMVNWLTETFTYVDPNRIYLRGSSMGGVGTVFSAIMLRDIFAGGLAIVPRFDYGADDIPLASQLTFATRWGPFEENVICSDGMGILDRLDASFLAKSHPEWDFAPVWAFNGRNDEAVGWSEKIPFYETMGLTAHGWSFYWDERAHGGQSPHPRAWREDGTEEAIFDWMVTNVRLDQSYPAFSNCTLDDDPGSGDPTDGDPVGTINGWLRWEAATIEDTADQWAIDLDLVRGAPQTSCAVDITARRRQAFHPTAGTGIRYEVRSLEDDRLLISAQGVVDELGRVRVRGVPVVSGGVRLTIRSD